MWWCEFTTKRGLKGHTGITSELNSSFATIMIILFSYFRVAALWSQSGPLQYFISHNHTVSPLDGVHSNGSCPKKRRGYFPTRFPSLRIVQQLASTPRIEYPSKPRKRQTKQIQRQLHPEWQGSTSVLYPKSLPWARSHFRGSCHRLLRH